MTNNNSPIAKTTSEPSINSINTQSTIDRLISTDIVTTSQGSMQLNMTNMIPSPIPVISDRSEDPFLRRRREARRREARRRQRQRRAQRRRERRTGGPHQRRARRRRRRNQQLWNRSPNQNARYEARFRGEQRHQEYLQYLLRRSPTFNEFFEEEIEQRNLQVYYQETFNRDDHWEQEQINEFEGIAALEQLLLFQDQIEQSQRIHALSQWEEEARHEQQHKHDEWAQEQLRHIETTTISQSSDSIFVDTQESK